MATVEETKLPLTSRDVHAERLAQLRELFPEAFSEGKADLKKLAQLLEDAATDAPERYGLSWTGKSDAIRAIQVVSPGTLLPAREESVNFDATENLIIEGDNLEVLKLLQGGYHGRVKMIYIDPPYNTGNEFIYPDNYKEGLADYLKFSGQVSGEGIKLTTNAETDGRYHSKWLTMMYPRLFLARNLLREDGVIFVSIDDHEVHNLRAMINEIFGEENFCGVFIWEKKKKPSFLNSNMGVVTEYILAAAKDRTKSPQFTFGKVEEGKKYPFNNAGNAKSVLTFPAQSVRFGLHDQKVSPQDMSEGNILTKLMDAVTIRDETNLNAFRLEGEWRYSQQKLNEFVDAGDEIYISKIPFRPNYINKEDRDKKTKNLLSISSDVVGTYEDATEELREIFGEDVLEYPKPTRLIRFLTNSVTAGNDLVLDFFAGSGTTAHAVLELNAQDGGNRKFILVQLPEPTERKDFPTIADITKERVRRVIKKLEMESTAKNAENTKKSESELPLEDAESLPSMRPLRQNQDLAFKVFKLSSSNFKVWDIATAAKDGIGLAEQLKLMAHNVVENRSDEALLYELILKSNLPLTSKIQSGKIGAQTFYDVADGTLAICLERPVTQETLRGLVGIKPRAVICLDIAFAGNDQLKTNTVLEMKTNGIEFHTA